MRLCLLLSSSSPRVHTTQYASHFCMSHVAYDWQLLHNQSSHTRSIRPWSKHCKRGLNPLDHEKICVVLALAVRMTCLRMPGSGSGASKKALRRRAARVGGEGEVREEDGEPEEHREVACPRGGKRG